MKPTAQKSKFKAGDEFVYKPPSKDAEPVWLTYIQSMKGGLHRLFSSETPALEYHIHEDSFCVGDVRQYPKPDLNVRYHAFAGNDGMKQEAYEKLMSSRGISVA